MIALSNGEPITSEYIAGSINTNPALVRKLMSVLKKNGFIKAQTKLGATGLAMAREEMSLRDVFKAVEKQQRLFAIHEDTNQNCPVGAKIGEVLERVNSEIQSRFETQLHYIHLSDILEGLK